MKTKVCSRCNIEKDIDNFRCSKGHYRGQCKQCEKELHDIYVSNNREKVNSKRKETYQKNIEHKHNIQRLYREKNRKKVDNYNKKYYEEHKEYFSNHAKKYKQEHFDEIKEYNKKWQENNKEHLKEIKKANNQKRMEIPLERMKNRVRNMIRTSFERKGMQKSSKTEEIVKCPIDTLIQELIESYERNYGREWKWEYLSEVHIDHIEPLANATTEEEVIKLCNHSNLQLLTEFDNLSKWKN